MRTPLPILAGDRHDAPEAPFVRLTARWIQLTGTWWGPDLGVEFVPVRYDHETLAREIEREGLPPEFAETVRTGWWTTCLENLPAKERARGRF